MAVFTFREAVKGRYAANDKPILTEQHWLCQQEPQNEML